jgi:prepilin-type processing-associated H-X9-DG protein
MTCDNCDVQVEQTIPKKFSIKKIFKILIYGLIIFVIIGAFFPRPCVASKKSLRVSCASNLKSIGLCLKQYAMDYKDYFPEKAVWEGWEELRINHYLTDYGIYICPLDSKEKGKSGPLHKENVSYIYLSGFMEGSSDETGIADTPLAFDIPSNHAGYINVLFLDGHVRQFETEAKKCRELIKFLDERIHYSPEHLKVLYKKADIADRMYNLK